MKVYMRDEEIHFFANELTKLKDGARIVEWGSGGSTRMILDYLKPKQTFTSIEHDVEWAEKVIKAVDGHSNREQMKYIVTKLETLHGVLDGKEVLNDVYEQHKKIMMGTFLEENPSYISNYIDPSDLHEDFKDILKSDFFLVDGLARGAVLATLKIKGKKKAKVLVHDYVGREHQYALAMKLYEEPKIVSTFALLTI